MGTLIGILYCCSYYFFHYLPGTTMTLVRVIDRIEYYIIPHHEKHSLLFQTLFKDITHVHWQVALVIGIFFGSLISSYLGHSRTFLSVPKPWAQSFGSSKIKRFFGAFIGGIIIMFGARIAGGCTSGLAIAYGLQLAVSAWIFILSLFVTGIIVAHILYRRRY